MRLDQDQKLPDYVSESELNAALSKAGKNPVSCASEFLSAVFNFTMQELKKRYGKTMVETMVENARIDYRLTVPAMWSLAAKSATRTAAKNAGMTKNVVLVSGEFTNYGNTRLDQHVLMDVLQSL